MVDQFSDDIAFHFIQAVRAAALPWQEQERLLGSTGSGIAWELRSDIQSYGTQFVNIEPMLSAEEREAISIYIQRSNQLVPEIFVKNGAGLRHPDWYLHRRRSLELLRFLSNRILQLYHRLDCDIDWLSLLLSKN
jgi:hypothetical protein